MRSGHYAAQHLIAELTDRPAAGLATSAATGDAATGKSTQRQRRTAQLRAEQLLAARATPRAWRHDGDHPSGRRDRPRLRQPGDGGRRRPAEPGHQGGCRLSPGPARQPNQAGGARQCESPNGAPGGAGKALRPALALLSARAADAAAERAVPAAVAVELVHNFSLLHDDIMDGDTERRHRPTAWTVYGVGMAILAGDALLALAQDLLLEGQPPESVWASRCLSAAIQRLIAGQGADLAFERRGDVTVAECLDMAGDKTAALMACACSIGAVYVGGPAGMAKSLAGFGAYAGLAFQLTDDLLGIWGAPEVTGKPVRSDLRARKKSLPVVAAHHQRHPGRGRTGRAARQAGSAQPRTSCCTRPGWSRRAAARSGRRPRRTPRSRRRSVTWPRPTCRMTVRAEFEAIAEFVTARQW